jgi:hypothetical protein
VRIRDPDEQDKTWWANIPPSDRVNEKLIWKRKKYPPEPEGFREWMEKTYPRANPNITWAYLWDNMRDIIKEFEDLPKER